jgi:hypothetical protein
MALHKVQTPDGQVITVNAPDGATEQEVIAYAQQNYKPPKPEPNTGLEEAAKETGVGQALLVSAGRSADKVVQGVRQLWNEGLSKFGDKEAVAKLDEIKQQEAEKDRAYKPLSEERPYATGIGGVAPFLTIGGRASIPAQMGMAAAIGGMKYGSPTDRVKEAMLEAAGTGVGAAAGKMLGKVINPVNPAVINDTRKAAMDAMIERGYQPRLSQVTGSPTAEAVERLAANTPGGRGVMRAQESANEVVFNKTAAKSIGQDATELSDEVLANARRELGQVFQDIKNLPGKTIEIDSNVGNKATDILREQAKLLPGQRDAGVIKLAQEAQRLSGLKAKIDGEAYQLQRSALSDAVEANEGMISRQYKQLLTALDDSAEASLQGSGNAKLAEQLREVRPKYANLMTLEKKKVVRGGDVNPQKMADKPARNELADVANFGDAFAALPKPFPMQSATDTITNALLTPASYLGALATTNPLLTGYARHVGGTKAAQVTGEVANRSLRSVIDAAMQKRLDDLRTNK